MRCSIYLVLFRYHQTTIQPKNEKETMHCPRIQCGFKLQKDRVDEHLIKVHNIGKTCVQAFTYSAVLQRHNDTQPYTQLCGAVKLAINAKDVLSTEEKELWWGPVSFKFDNITFYQLVYKKKDLEGTYFGRNEVGHFYLYTF